MEFITPTEITPSTGSWLDVDVSAHIPEGATGVMLHILDVEKYGSSHVVGFRKNGSTDDRKSSLTGWYSHCWASIGVDESRILEIYASNVDIEVYLVGYFGSEATFFTNGIDVEPSTGSWLDVDISGDTGDDTAIAAIIEAAQTVSGLQCGFRKNGSTDDRHSADTLRYPASFIVGVDESEVYETYISGAQAILFLSGYLTSGATLNTNATDLSLGSTNSWIDLTALPVGALGGFIEVYGTADYKSGLRKNGSSEDIVYYVRRGTQGLIECDEDRLVEGEISNTGVDFYLTGYAITVAPTANPKSFGYIF